MTTLLVKYLPVDTLRIVDSFLCPIQKHHTPNHLARRGSIHGLIWLNKYRPTAFTGQKPMLLAAQYGFLHIVQWLHTHGYSEQGAIAYAAQGGHAHIINWLQNKQYPTTQTSIVVSLNYSHYDIARNLLTTYERTGRNLNAIACLTAICCNGFVPALDWFMAHFPQTRLTLRETKLLMTQAVRNGRYGMTRALHLRYNARPALHSLDFAIRRGALDVVQYCLEHELDELSQFSVSDAIVNGHHTIVEYINPQSIHKWAFNIACMKGHFRLIKWIYLHYPHCVDVKETLSLMRTSLYSNPDKDVVRWLRCLG